MRFLRSWQTWLARYQTPHQRLQSGIDAILHVLDWIPVRLAGVVYALLGHGEKALPAWFASLADLHTSQYQVLTRLAQFSLAREPHTGQSGNAKGGGVDGEESLVCGSSDYCRVDSVRRAGVTRFCRRAAHALYPAYER
ncbi:AmpE protein [Salmonella enterica subsp. arizonae]|uniref:AmpE protein n=1 Tax=Salmonella enterica subsp. arizonae TaxID=59203 RepID=A0A379TIU9_SALER|nr:AmpE protein [Salmonella enterica subsp. arizonae]